MRFDSSTAIVLYCIVLIDCCIAFPLNRSLLGLGLNSSSLSFCFFFSLCCRSSSAFYYLFPCLMNEPTTAPHTTIFYSTRFFVTNMTSDKGWTYFNNIVSRIIIFLQEKSDATVKMLIHQIIKTQVHHYHYHTLNFTTNSIIIPYNKTVLHY